jgi:hypothetical protein
MSVRPGLIAKTAIVSGLADMPATETCPWPVLLARAALVVVSL